MLIPIAIAINIILGQTVAAALKVPIYLDSIGTILVGVLAGPIAGALTGALANLIWTYVLPAPFHADYAAPFCDRRRRDRPAGRRLRSARVLPQPSERARPGAWSSGPSSPSAILAVLVFYGFLPFYSDRGRAPFFGDRPSVAPAVLRHPGWLAVGAARRGAVGLVALLLRAARPGVGVRRRRRRLVRRRLGDDLGPDLGASSSAASPAPARTSWSRPSSRPVPTSRRRSSSRACISDPIDKTITFFVVFVLLQAPVAPVHGALPAGRAGGRPGGRVARCDPAADAADARWPASRRRHRPPYHRLNPLTKAVVATVDVDRRVRHRRLPRARCDHRRWRSCRRRGRRRPAPARPDLVPADAADRDLGRARQRLHPGRARPSCSCVGPFDATLEGVDFAGQILVRLFAISTAIGLFGLTTDPRALVIDLERRGPVAALRVRRRRHARGGPGDGRAGRASSQAPSAPRARHGGQRPRPAARRPAARRARSSSRRSPRSRSGAWPSRSARSAGPGGATSCGGRRIGGGSGSARWLLARSRPLVVAGSAGSFPAIA